MKHPLADVPDPCGTILLHSFFSADLNLDIPVHLEANVVESGDEATMERLLVSFSTAREAEERLGHTLPKDGLWNYIGDVAHGEAYRLLEAGDLDALAGYLSNGLRTPLCAGLGPGPIMYRQLADESSRNSVLLWIKDRMLSACLAVGALRLENPEGSVFGHLMHIPLPEIVERIEAVTHIAASRRPVMGLSGASIGPNRVVDIKMPDDVYSAERVKALMPPGSTIADLGGGFGGAALQFTRAGMHTVMFDLPIMCMVQGYFLIKTLGSNQVSLFGEEFRPGAVRVLPWWKFYDRSIRFDIIFNRDSMTEFHEAVATRYLIEAKERKVPFLSINHESGASYGPNGKNRHIIVRELAEIAGLRRRLRVPYWIRRGYVEELYHAIPLV